MQLALERHGSHPLYMQVVTQIQERIRSGALPIGTRLPPIRQLANELGLTRLTVHSAYSELQAGGWIESFVGRGSYVSQRPLPQRAPVASLLAPPLLREEPGDFGELLRLAAAPDMISFAQAAPAYETFPIKQFNRAMQQVLAEADPALYGYGATQGDARLREQLALLLLDRGIQAPPENILVVSGAQQGIDIVLRALVPPGETVLVEEPTYLGMVERMQAYGPNLVGIPMDDEGIRLDALEAALIAHQPRLLYTIPAYHNPTGICMSPARQAAVLELAQRYRVPILEDDIYGLLSYDNPPPSCLKAIDRGGIVVYLSSFSKVLLPGLRLGLLTATPPVLQALVAAKRLTDLHAPPLTQRALAEYLERGHFSVHVHSIRSVYRERRDVMVRQLQRSFPRECTWRVPGGGFCVWVTLPPSIRVADVYAQAVERGVVFAPGPLFSADPHAPNGLRLCFAARTPAQIVRGITILGEVLYEQLARRPRPQPATLCHSVPLV